MKNQKKILDHKQQVFISTGQLAASTSETFSQSHWNTLPLNADSRQTAYVWTSAPISSYRTLRKLHSSLYLSFIFWERGLKLYLLHRVVVKMKRVNPWKGFKTEPDISDKCFLLWLLLVMIPILKSRIESHLIFGNKLTNIFVGRAYHVKGHLCC